MNSALILSDLMQAASFASAVVLLVLQIRAFRRHSHVSFALLSATSVAALLYLIIWQIMALLAYEALPAPLWLYLLATAFFLFQIIFGTWGTISLFKAYRQLSEKVGGAENTIHSLQPNDAPITAILQVPLASGSATPPVASKPTLLERLNDVGERVFSTMPSALIARDKHGRDGLVGRVDGLAIRRFPSRGESCRGGTSAETEQSRAEKQCGVTS